jgi:AraC-like DNA-binding protein
MSSKQDLLLNAVMRRLNRAPFTPLGKLAGELNVSTRTLQNVVKLATGKTFCKLRDELLVRRVKTLLQSDPTRAIKELSFELGYKSPRSFARAVKQECGFSPEQLRSQIIFHFLRDEKESVC